MPVELHHPLVADFDRYQLILHEEEPNRDQLNLLLSHAQSLEQELKEALGTKRWMALETELSIYADLVLRLDFPHRKKIFVDTTTGMENTRDFETYTVLEHKYWANRLLTLAILCTTLLVMLNVVAVVGPEEISNTALYLLVPGALAVITVSSLLFVKNRQYNRSADALAAELTGKIATLHREALETQGIEFPTRE